MLKFIILGAAITVLVFAVGYIIYYISKAIRTKQPMSANEKRGLLAAIGAVLLSALVIYKQTRKN
jgi:hypothetical protein